MQTEKGHDREDGGSTKPGRALLRELFWSRIPISGSPNFRALTRKTVTRKTGILRKSMVALGMAGGLICALWGAEPTSLTTLHAVHALTMDEARRELPVAFEATVIYYNKSDVDLFVQDGDEAMYVETKQDEDLTPGDRVQVDVDPV